MGPTDAEMAQHKLSYALQEVITDSGAAITISELIEELIEAKIAELIEEFELAVSNG